MKSDLPADVDFVNSTLFDLLWKKGDNKKTQGTPESVAALDLRMKRRNMFKHFLREAQHGLFNPNHPKSTADYDNRLRRLSETLSKVVFRDITEFDYQYEPYFNDSAKGQRLKNKHRSRQTDAITKQTKTTMTTRFCELLLCCACFVLWKLIS